MLAQAAGRIARHDLTGRLVVALDRGALLLVAGAGFGKTTALEDALATRGGAVAWVRCSEAHRDAGRLLEDTIASLREAAPGVADVLGERLSAGGEPVDVDAAAGLLVGELERLLVDPVTIAFDDAEALVDAPRSTEVIARLVAARSPALRVVVATRQPLSLRLAKLRAGGQVTEVGAAELAFSAAECAELLQQRSARPPPEAEVADVWAATEGWPLAVALLAPGRSPAALPTAGAGSLSAFLLEEVLDSLAPPMRTDVIESSLAPDLDAELAASLGLAPDFLDRLERLGLPLRRTETESGARLTHHPLVRDFLRDRLARERPEERRRELHARCAAALDAAGRGIEAVEHWLAAAAGTPEAAASAAAAVARYGHALARTAPATVGGWLARLPDQVRAAPELRLLEGRLAGGDGRLDEAVTTLRRAAEGFAARGDEDSAWVARAALADSLAILEDFDSAISLADGWKRAPAPTAPIVGVAAASALAGLGRYSEASSTFESVLAHEHGGALEPLVRAFHGFWVDLQCGRLDSALAALQHGVTHLERDDPFARLPYAIGMQAVVLEERGEDAAALDAIGRARRAAQESALGGYIHDVEARFRAGVHARAGRLADAQHALEQATGGGLGWYRGDRELTEATIAAATGRRAEAAEAAQRALDAGALEPWRARWRNTNRLAPVLVAAGRADWAAQLVGDALAVRPPLASRVRLLALRAWLRSLEGDTRGALDDLGTAWEEAGTETAHLVRRELPRLEPLLWEALDRGVLPASPVLAALAAADPGGDALMPLTRHPAPEIRRAALVAVAAAGHPGAPARATELESDADPGVAGAARDCRARLSRERPGLAVRLLGGFELRRGAYVLREGDWSARGRAAQRLLRFLFVHHGTAVPEDVLFDAFWPGRDAAAARRSLQVTVSSARSVLEPFGAERSSLVVTDRTYRLELSGRDVVDAHEFERLARVALDASGADRAALLEAAAARWGGEPLPEDRYEQWAAGWRERLVDRQRRVLAALAETRADAGDHAGAIDAAGRQVELDPLDESAHRRLMLVYARAGRRGHALRQYLACRRALVDELAIEPAAETADLQRRILAGDPV